MAWTILILSLVSSLQEWEARTLFERSASEGVRLSADGASIELDRGELFEDDGPAAGYSYRPNEEPLQGEVWIRKEFLIPNPAAARATLLVAPGGDLKARINGRELPLEKAGLEGKYWQAYTFDPAALVPGRNEIDLHGSGKVWIARDDEFAAGSLTRPRHPDRSLRSDDGGKTWRRDRLGAARDVDGEYCVRLFLDRHRAEGRLVLPVIDAGNPGDGPVGPPVASPGPVSVHAEAGGAGTVRVRLRSGTSPSPASPGWSDWQEGVLEKPVGRFVQVEVRLATPDPRATPRLGSVRIEAKPAVGEDWSRRLKVFERGDAEIVRTSIPFRYEPFDRPELRRLREEFKLDEVVRGAAGEFELVTRLAGWTGRQWEQGHLREAYPAWNALEILKPHADGKPVGGFCQQYNVVFLQACESFGLAGRAVSIGPGRLSDRIQGGGHEVVEIWSNEHGKWVHVDADTSWYFVDGASGVPLSLLELRERQLAAVEERPHAAVRVVEIGKARRSWEGLKKWPPFIELRLIPRSNFLEERAPLPLHQGMRGWFWTGHHAWSDERQPAALLYGHRVGRRGNFEWTLNQARVVLEAAAEGELRVHLETETPGFASFDAGIDGAKRTPVESGFAWKLHAGRNTLEVGVRNTAGREGPVRRVVIESP